MRWKAFHHDNPNTNSEKNKKTYGFNSPHAPPQNEHLKSFESAMYDMVQNLQSKRSLSEFQRRLANDTKAIKESPNLLVYADKTTNLYSLNSDQYNKLLSENITTTYKKVSSTSAKSIDIEAKKIATKLELSDRIETTAQKDAYLTLKDHKKRFIQDPKCRLINPTKSEIGMISKQILDNINTNVRNAKQLNQWTNTSDVISWFEQIKDKKKAKFIKFDIVEFYPSITQELLIKAIEFAKQFTNISKSDIDIIFHCRKCILFSNKNTWIKSDQDLPINSFDVPMGSFDGAEICETVGLYLLNELEKIFGENVMGLYRDDGLGCLKNTSGPKTERTRKDLIKMFQNHNLKITVDTNLTTTDFLDVTFDLNNNTYSPYIKPNNEPLYINVKSNHPPSIIKQLPKMIGQRISDNSSNKDLFMKAKKTYDKALKASGFTEKIAFLKSEKNRAKNRPRKVIWFNPPYSEHIKTDVGKQFINLLHIHFPKYHKYHKLFNKNNVKLSYSCMPNMSQIISSHNKSILAKNEIPHTKKCLCNCRTKSDCPLQNRCLETSLIYKATVKSENVERVYVGCTEGAFKYRYANHLKSFKHRTYSNETELSKYVWKLKDENEQFKIAWSIERKSAPYVSGSRKCDLCITEKMVIATSNPVSLLNSRAEILGTCRHRNKYLLKNV